VIACIEAALVNGQSQPWMYTVLALAMKKAGRPSAEVERVLLSTVDFSAVNVPNLLYSAAFLTRFGAKERALDLYIQTSKVDPTRLEPYVLGLKLAREKQDPVAIEWAATGILTRAWNQDHAALHREAEATVRELEAALRRHGREPEADHLAEALNQALERDLAIELSWSGKADLDLLVEEPGGTICSSENPGTLGGGVFVHDGLGVTPQDSFDQYVCPRGMSGDYRVIVRHIRGDVVGKRAVLKITRYQGTSREVEERFTVPLSDQDKIVRVTLQHGRLKALTSVPLLDVAPRQRVAGRPYRREAISRAAHHAARAGAGNGARGSFTAGGFGAVGYQSVISILSEGVALSALAVISADRRYVRLSLNPAFSAITGVNTFSFITSGGGGAGSAGGGNGGAGGGTGAGGQNAR
jgi:PAS domain-containing protein